MFPSPIVTKTPSVSSLYQPTSTQNARGCRLACVMVGLPARGKTYIAQKLCRYLHWLGHSARVFNVGNYRRRKADGAHAEQDAAFFDPHNQEAARLRKEASLEAIRDMLQWFETGETTGDDTEPSNRSYFSIERPKQLDALVDPESAAHFRALARARGAVAIYDATNSTEERRQTILSHCQAAGVDVLFIESICNDPEVIAHTIRDVKLSSPDYRGMDPTVAAADFMARIAHYEKAYQTLSAERTPDLTFVQLIDCGRRLHIHRMQDYVQARIVYYLMNLHVRPRCIFLSRHGESLLNVAARIGGDADLSPRGQKFARALPQVMQQWLKNEPFTVWTSTLKRTIQTAEYLPFPSLQWKALDELDAGCCDGLTYEEIAERYPQDFAARDEDKYNYRYPGGESYHDLVLRLEPIIMELERQSHVLIVAHQAVLRAIYAYYFHLPHDALPYIDIPLHTVLKLTPRAYGCLEERHRVDVGEAVADTYRARPSSRARSPVKEQAN